MLQIFAVKLSKNSSVPNKYKLMIVIGVYRSPNRDQDMCLGSLVSPAMHLGKQLRTNDRLLIGGDFNVDPSG